MKVSVSIEGVEIHQHSLKECVVLRLEEAAREKHFHHVLDNQC